MTALAAHPQDSIPRTTSLVRSDAQFRADAARFTIDGDVAADRVRVGFVCAKTLQSWLMDAWKHVFQTIEQGGGRTNLLEHSDPSDSSSD